MISETDPAAPAAPAPETDSSAEQTPDTPLSQLNERLEDIINTAEYDEMWGIKLSNNSADIPAQIILQKFLRANGNDVAAAEKQLVSALIWRKETDPRALLEEAFDRTKFDGLGYVTVHKDESGKETVITWNIYGAVKDKKATFGDVEEFVRWRTALMELGVQQLRLDEASELIPENGEDPYQMLQVHDYRSVSFFRLDSNIKAATKKTIHALSLGYPELLAHKYFVNVPTIMSWMFGAMKFFLTPNTLKKFHPMASGTALSTELKDIASTLPEEYGGQGPSVKDAMTVVLTEPVEGTDEDTSASEPSQEETMGEEALAEAFAAIRTDDETPILPVPGEASKDGAAVTSAQVPEDASGKEASIIVEPSSEKDRSYMI